MNWYKLYTITQIILIVMLLFGGIYFYFMIKDRMEIFEDPLNYVIQNYGLNSCTCGINSGGNLIFSDGKVQVQKPNDNPSNIIFEPNLNLNLGDLQ